MLSQLTVQLYPSTPSHSLSIYYDWDGVSAEVIELEVTTPLEAMASSIDGVTGVFSRTSKGYGWIEIDLKKESNIDAVRFELASLVRTIFPKLPKGVGRPRVYVGSQSNNNHPLLMTFVVNGEESSQILHQLAEKYFSAELGKIDQIEKVEVVGSNPMEWQVIYDPIILEQIEVTVDDIQDALRLYFQKKTLGRFSIEESSNSSYSSFSFLGSGMLLSEISWDEIPIKKLDRYWIRLGKIAKVIIKESEPRRYFRINGLNTVYVNLYSVKGTNQITLGNKIRTMVEQLCSQMPSNVSFELEYDASRQLELERNRILKRSGFALLILLIFVFIVSRDIRYLFVVIVSIGINLFIAVIGYVYLDIQIHIYSLAGITVSLGIMIDNTIVMVDHYKYGGKEKIFLAIFAATLTTLGALSIVFLLKPSQRLLLTDFSMVMVVNLVVSLLVAFLFIPSFLDKVPLRQSHTLEKKKHLRRVILFNKFYRKYIIWGCHHRSWVIIMAIFIFGVPFFLLPSSIGSNTRNMSSFPKEEQQRVWYERLYNYSIGSQIFQMNILPFLNRYMGGTVYRFSKYYEHHIDSQKDHRVILHMRLSMPDGATLERMNAVVMKLENLLVGYNQIERFIATVYSANESEVEIHFKDAYRYGRFPFILKERLIQFAEENGSVDSRISGVGKQDYNNVIREVNINQFVVIKGYSYPLLMKLANQVKALLKKQRRVKEVIISSGTNYVDKKRFEYVARLNTESITLAQGTVYKFYNRLKTIGEERRRIFPVGPKNFRYPLTIISSNNTPISVWNLKQQRCKEEKNGFLRIDNVANMEKQLISGSIDKENQEYYITVGYEFNGNIHLARKIRENYCQEIERILPIGFSILDQKNLCYWDAKDQKQYMLLGIVLLIIFFVCAILLESLIQPWAIILMIPLSFVGIFGIFTITEFPFNQGGYASMILLSGITVNSGLYIIYGYNYYCIEGKKKGLNGYLYAFQKKIIPIALTVLSTIMGLIPFLFDHEEVGFWFDLALGTIGGLLFSFLVIVVWLPVFLNVTKKN